MLGSYWTLRGRQTIICLLLVSLTGCAIRGPDAMRTSRLRYNEAMQASEQRELLLNLVRLRYSDAPEFLVVSAITSQMNFEAQASIAGDFGEVEDNTSAFVSPGASVGYSETPTVTFVPQRDQEFTRQLVAPVELDSLYLLTQYGWGLDRVLRLIVRDLNGLSNTISRQVPSNDQATSLQVYADTVRRLRSLEEAQLISVNVEQREEILTGPIPAENLAPSDLFTAIEAGYRWKFQQDSPSYVLSSIRSHYVLRIDPSAWADADFSVTARMLGLAVEQTTYEIDPGDDRRVDNDMSLRIATRSVLGSMAYLSNAVSVPKVHEEQGLVPNVDAIQATLQDLLMVRVSDTPVEHAFISIPYRGFWFYVDDADLETKRTLGLLTSLIRLTIRAGGAENVPVLTLPVSR